MHLCGALIQDVGIRSVVGLGAMGAPLHLTAAQHQLDRRWSKSHASPPLTSSPDCGQSMLPNWLRGDTPPLVLTMVIAVAAAGHLAYENKRLIRASERVASGEVVQGERRSASTVLLLTENDCSARLQTVIDLDKRFKAGERISGAIVTDEDSAVVLHAVRQQLGVSFPLYAVSSVDAGAFLSATGIRRTPVSIRKSAAGQVVAIETIEAPDDQ